METVFLHVLNSSITASWLVLAVILLRLLLKKSPKALMVLLWGLVGLRLICPFSIESTLSLIPSAEPVPPDILLSDAPEIQSGIPFLNATVNPMLSASLAPEVGASVNPMQVIVYIASAVWIVGLMGMLTYSMAAYFRLRHKVRISMLHQDNIYLCDDIASPFILGVFRPRIYLPSGLAQEQMQYVIAHEKAHLKRKDQVWKSLGFLLLSVHWFNPILWLAFILLCCDIEFACDEKVIRHLDGSGKKGYSEALVACSIQRRTVMTCPLAFGEVKVKERVRSVLLFKKPAVWGIVAAVVLCVVVTIPFLTNPPAANTDNAVYSYSGSVDPIEPRFVLYENEQRFAFTYSVYSSYLAMGTYTLTEDVLTLSTEDGMYTYVFAVKKDTFVFDAERSSPIPVYRYSSTDREAKSPVPDGAVFKKSLSVR